MRWLRQWWYWGRQRLLERFRCAPESASRQRADAREGCQGDPALKSLLREILRRPVVEGIAYAGIDPSDCFQVFLAGPAAAPHVFACAVVSEGRFRRMLDEDPFVAEGFSLQVVGGIAVTQDGIRRGLAAWAERNFKDISTPEFRVVLLEDADGGGYTATLDPLLGTGPGE